MRFLRRVAVVACLTWLTSCVGPWGMKAVPADAGIYSLDSVVVMDNRATDWRPLSYVTGARAEAGRVRGEVVDGSGNLRVSAELKNNRASAVTLQVQTVFYDGERFPTGDETNWEHIVVPRRSIHLYTTSSMKPAQHFQVRVRYE
jgi:hypothetical protein